MLKTAKNAKNFVVRNKTKLLVTGLVVTTTLVVVQRRALQMHNEYLKDLGLYEAYYFVEE